MIIHLKRLLSLSIFLISFQLVLNAQEKKSSDLGIIKGTVTNNLGFPIAKASIVFESQSMLVEVTTDETGQYGIGLVRDTYDVRINEWKGKLPYSKNEPFYFGECLSYFRPSYHSSIKLQAPSENTLNLVLVESGCLNWEKDQSFGSFMQVTDVVIPGKRHHETISVGDSKLQINVEYENRKIQNNSVIYESSLFRQTPPKFNKMRPGIIVSYNFQTAYARSAVFDKKQNILTLSGDIVLEDNEKIMTPKKLEIRIKDNIAQFITN